MLRESPPNSVSEIRSSPHTSTVTQALQNTVRSFLMTATLFTSEAQTHAQTIDAKPQPSKSADVHPALPPIEQLGSESFKEREAASVAYIAALKATKDRALLRLINRARMSSDAEVKGRAQKIWEQPICIRLFEEMQNEYLEHIHKECPYTVTPWHGNIHADQVPKTFWGILNRAHDAGLDIKNYCCLVADKQMEEAKMTQLETYPYTKYRLASDFLFETVIGDALAAALGSPDEEMLLEGALQEIMAVYRRFIEEEEAWRVQHKHVSLRAKKEP